MSPRNDTFLSLCIAQAELSPIHYRHGSIIIKGGKVIGQGFNTYSPGFDGGCLKTGVLPSDGSAMTSLKDELKSKSNFKPENRHKSSFTPFELNGAGYNANTPLSLHSEMAAIRSALSLSSGGQSGHVSARSAKCLQKPCFSLQGDSKKRKARASGLKAYAEAVCGTESGFEERGFGTGSFESGVQGGGWVVEEEQSVQEGERGEKEGVVGRELSV